MSEQQIIDHHVPSLELLEAATHYRAVHGEVGPIVERQRGCISCEGTTRIETAAGVWSTFTRLHVAAGCLR